VSGQAKWLAEQNERLQGELSKTLVVSVENERLKTEVDLLRKSRSVTVKSIDGQTVGVCQVCDSVLPLHGKRTAKEDRDMSDGTVVPLPSFNFPPNMAPQDMVNMTPQMAPPQMAQPTETQVDPLAGLPETLPFLAEPTPLTTTTTTTSVTI